MIVVMLGMHRSRTSMVARMLAALGVNMGDRLLGANKWNRWGHWEDLDFLEINIQILEAAGGNWAHPPGRDEIEQAGRWFYAEAERLVRWKGGQGRKAWGWKDPRTCLTWPVWWAVFDRLALMNEVRVVHVVRDSAEVVGSLMRRTAEAGAVIQGWIEEGLCTEEDAEKDKEMQEWGRGKWWELVRYYEMNLEAGLWQLGPDLPAVKIETGGRLDGVRAAGMAVELAEFVGVEDERAIRQAVKMVEVGDR